MNHLNISLIKSALRIIGFIFLINNLMAAVIFLVIAEILGVAEELV